MIRGAPLSVVPGSGQGSTVGPFMIYPVRPQSSAGRKAATLGDYLDSIYRRKWWIFAVVMLATGGAFGLSRMMPRLYESTATLDVDRLTPNAVVGPQNLTQVAPDMDQFVATHVRMLQSDAVLRPVALSFSLAKAEGNKDGDLRKGPVRLKRLKVFRPPNTYLIQISYRHTDPEVAAAVANSIANTYLDHLRALREGAWSNLSGASQRQLAELREKMEQSNQALLEFQRRIGMVDPEDKTNVLSSRLLQLNTDYARAQADRAAKQASYDAVRTGIPEAAEASVHGELLKKLIERKAEAAQKFSDVRALYGENHSEYRRAQAQLVELDEQLKSQYRKAVERAASELREARLRETNLMTAYVKSKAEADTISSHGLESKILRQRAEADRQLYEELARKLGEAEINSGLRASPLKVADAARADWKPASPNVPLNCAVALIVSLIAGCAGAVLLDTRRSTVRSADDLKTICGPQVLTVLPAVRAWRGRRGLSMFSEDAQKPKPGQWDIQQFREQVRMLRNGLSQPLGTQRPKVVAVVSPASGEGRTRIAAELANAFAAAGRRTILIDADLRAPALHTLFFSTGPRTGLCTALSGKTAWRQAIMRAVQSDSTDLLPSGPPDQRSRDLLHQRLNGLLEDVEDEYDTIVLDTPPFLRFSESLDLARAVDAVITVARAGITDLKEFETMLGYLERVNATVAAVVLNDVQR